MYEQLDNNRMEAVRFDWNQGLPIDSHCKLQIETYSIDCISSLYLHWSPSILSLHGLENDLFVSTRHQCLESSSDLTYDSTSVDRNAHRRTRSDQMLPPRFSRMWFHTYRERVSQLIRKAVLDVVTGSEKRRIIHRTSAVIIYLQRKLSDEPWNRGNLFSAIDQQAIVRWWILYGARFDN